MVTGITAERPKKKGDPSIMKRFLTILLATLALSAALCVSASASSFDGAARELSTIGMLKGTADGFDLDKAPTRAQAAIMLVRLYGAEERAQGLYSSGRITCPFADVNETAAPYVAWLVDEGLANGITETSFGAAEPCTAKAYTIFLLRALGYEDGSDFTAATAQSFAAGLGIMDTSALTGTFLRDDLAALTYQALGTDLKDGSTYLLDSLIQEDTVDYNDAFPIVDKIERYRALSKASEAAGKGMSANLDLAMAVTVTNQNLQEMDQVQHTKITGKGQIKMILDKNPQLALEMKMTVDGQENEVKTWLRDGWMYSQSGDQALKSEMPEAYLELMNPSKNSGASVLPFLESVTVKTSGAEQVYSVELNDAFTNLLNTLVGRVVGELGLPEDMLGAITLDNFLATYTVKNGTLRKASADMGLSMGVKDAETALMFGISLQFDMDVVASGSAVKITYPDFSKFEEVIGGADGPTGIYAA